MTGKSTITAGGGKEAMVARPEQNQGSTDRSQTEPRSQTRTTVHEEPRNASLNELRKRGASASWRCPHWMLAGLLTLSFAPVALYGQTSASDTQTNQQKLQAYQQQLSNYLTQVEKAAQQGKVADAQNWLQRLIPRKKWLTQADQKRLAALEVQLNTASKTKRPSIPTVATPGIRPEERLRQARALLSRGHWEAAHAIAKDLANLKGRFDPKGDNPTRLLKDISNASSDAKWLLRASRAALKQGDFEQAQRLAQRAEAVRGTFTFPFWGDTPSKALKDIRTAMASQRKRIGGGEEAAEPMSTAQKQANEKARKLLAQAHQMLNEGNYPAAQKLAEQAKALKPKLPWWGATPEKILAAVQRQSSKPTTKDKVEPKGSDRDKALAMLKQGREALKAGKIDQAKEMLEKVKSMSDVSYGIFDDTPRRFASDIQETVRDNEKKEAGKLLVQARQLFKKGELEEAKKLAFRAQKLHGPYQLWNFGDRPDKLLAEIRAEELKKKPTVASTQLKTESKTPEAKPVVDPKKQQVYKMLAEARSLHSQGKLMEARQKVMDAQKVGVKFKAGEYSPEREMLNLASTCRVWTDRLMQQASATAASAGTNAQAYAQAEKQLKYAHYISKAFGHDVNQVEAKMQQVGQLKARVGMASASDRVPTPKTVVKPTTPSGADPKGIQLIQKARLELKNGETRTARKLAIAAYNGKYGVKQWAGALLKEIDAEENNQRILSARRAFDAGVLAFNRRDYLTARNILVQVNSRDLDDVRGSQYRELMASPELGAIAKVPTSTKPALGKEELQGDPDLIKQVKQDQWNTGRASVTDKKSDIVTSTKAMEDILFQQLRQDSLDIQQDASDRFRAGDVDLAIEMLQDHLIKLGEKRVDPEKLALLRRPIESRVQRFKLLKTQKDIEARRNGPKVKALSSIAKESLARRNRTEKVNKLMKDFYARYKEGKYEQALVLAQQAHEMDPDNEAVLVSIGMTNRMIRLAEVRAVRKENDETYYKILTDADKVGPAVNSDNPLYVDPKAAARARQRGRLDIIPLSPGKMDKEKEIESMLQTPVSLNFDNKPIEEVVEYIRQTKAINIAFERHALREEGIELDRPVSIKLDQITLKSALNILLDQLHLTWVVKNEALMITTEQYAKGKLNRKAYHVLDLVTPIPEHTLPVTANLQETLARSSRAFNGNNGLAPSTSPMTTPSNLNNGAPVGMPSSSSSASEYNSGGFASSSEPTPKWSKGKTGPTMDEALKNLIVNTIEPDTWAVNGGKGTIDYFPLGSSMVINQTQDIQEQIAELLDALRRLQDQEVAIEVRLISVADGFFERIGMDFSMNIKTNGATRRFEPQITSGQFAPAGFINDFNPSNLIVGTTPGGNFTQDLDIPISPTSFARAVPPFGGFQNAPGSVVGDGGLTLGLAFLSDIQVFMFMEAAQGDQRTNVMQAPKLTMFNGQTASLTVQTQQFFVTNVTAVQNAGQLAFVPDNTPFSLGISLTFQPVISADRRFVRLNANFALTNLGSAIVPLFPIVTAVQPFFEGVGAVGQPTLFTQFLQQPVFQTVGVQTTVVVPDGGTVLLGGLKRLSEGRNEFGPPILSKIPYINRLFKNVGYGREAESILMMVTPRIIINEEEEIEQTGVRSRPNFN